MTTIRYGKIDNLYVNDDDGIGNTIIIGNGVNDIVSAIGSQNDTITLGNGINDLVSAGNSSYDTIILGNGKLSSTFTASPALLPRVMTPSPSP